MRRLTPAFILLTLAVFALPLIMAKTVGIFSGLAVGTGGALIWLTGIKVAVNRYGVRAYWLTLTAPVGLFWPLFLAFWFYRASHGDPHWMMS